MGTQTQNRLPEHQRTLIGYISRRVEQTFRQRNILGPHDPMPRFWALPYPDRLVLIMDLSTFHGKVEQISNPRFEHALQTNLDGRMTVITNSRGIAFQISWDPEKVREIPDYVEFNPDERIHPLYVPLGMGLHGPVSVPLPKLNAVLIAGARQHGKTSLIHSWILALLKNSQGAARGKTSGVRLLLFDGKEKAKFGMYEGLPGVEAVTGTGLELAQALANIRDKMAARWEMMRERGVQHIMNLPLEERPPYLIILVDEAALALKVDGVEAMLQELITKGGDAGVLPILIFHVPDRNNIPSLMKVNLPTRISFFLPDGPASHVALGRWGAENLPSTPGRFLIKWDEGFAEIQGYYVPDKMIADQVAQLRGEQSAPLVPITAAPAPLAFTEEEIQMIRAALALGGDFYALKISNMTGISRSRVENCAKAWEAQGLLTAPQNGREGRVPRKVTPRLAGQAGLAM
jgi:hypothetical protein